MNRFGIKIKSSTRATYEKALEFLELQRSSKYRIVGTDPFVSPVPLEELEHYKLEYKSPTTIITRGEETVSQVEIFKYSP